MTRSVFSGEGPVTMMRTGRVSAGASRVASWRASSERPMPEAATNAVSCTVPSVGM